MVNLLILGSGRSGTSMVAGMFRKSGAYLGDMFLKPTISNPLGYYEDYEINSINNIMVDALLRWPCFDQFRRRILSPIYLDKRCFWIVAPFWLRRPSLPSSLIQRVRECVARQPFCYKDPRFNTTLHLWRPYLPEPTHFIVVFRQPARTVDSMLRDAMELYNPPLPINWRTAYRLWQRIYSRLLYQARNNYHWIFVHYDDVISGEAIPVLEAFSGVKLDTSEVNQSISRSTDWAPKLSWLTHRCMRLYSRLVERARSDKIKWGTLPQD